MTLNMETDDQQISIHFLPRTLEIFTTTRCVRECYYIPFFLIINQLLSAINE